MYDDNLLYIPGESWNEENQCYKTELDNLEDDYLEEGNIII